MNNPLVSVIIPAYNHERYVVETIESIINQDYNNIELIIINDGSADATWPLIEELEPRCKDRFVNVSFTTQANTGTCITLNRLIAQTQGKYVYLIASDDVAKKHSIEKQVAFLEANDDYGLIVGDNEFIDSESKQCYWDKSWKISYDEASVYKTFASALRAMREEVDFLSTEFGQYKSLCRGNYVPNGYLIRKSVLDSVGPFTPDAPLEDYWLMLQIAKISKLKFIDEVLFSYRWHANNTASQREKMLTMTDKTQYYEFETLFKPLADDNLMASYQAVKRIASVYEPHLGRYNKLELEYRRLEADRDAVRADRDAVLADKAAICADRDELQSIISHLGFSSVLKYLKYPRWMVNLACVFIFNKSKRRAFREKRIYPKN